MKEPPKQVVYWLVWSAIIGSILSGIRWVPIWVVVIPMVIFVVCVIWILLPEL